VLIYLLGNITNSFLRINICLYNREQNQHTENKKMNFDQPIRIRISHNRNGLVYRPDIVYRLTDEKENVGCDRMLYYAW